MTIYPDSLTTVYNKTKMNYNADAISNDKTRIEYKLLEYNDYEIFMEVITKIVDDFPLFTKAIHSISHLKSNF